MRYLLVTADGRPTTGRLTQTGRTLCSDRVSCVNRLVSIANRAARGYDDIVIVDIRKLRQNSPFVPFTIHMADGRQFQVPTLDHFLIVGSRAVVLNDNDSIEIVPTLLMSGITTDISALPTEDAESR